MADSKDGAARAARGGTSARGRTSVRGGGIARGKRAVRAPSMAVRRACFLEALRRTGNVSLAAREAGLASSTVYAQRGRLASFAAEWDAAIEEAMDELEASLRERAIRGVEKPVFFRGEQIGSVRSYSDALAMFLLRARRPQVFDRADAPAIRGGGEMTQEEARAEIKRRLTLLAAAHAADEAAAGETDGACATDERWAGEREAGEDDAGR